MRLSHIEERLRCPGPPVDAADVTELRERRSDLGSLESQISFLRRMLQSRIDLIEAALAAHDDTPGADERMRALLAAVPGVLVRGGPPGAPRSPRHRGLVDPDLELVAEIETEDAIALLDVPGASPDQLRRELRRLVDLERRVSDLRQELHRSIDAIQADIARRYRTGELSVSG